MHSVGYYHEKPFIENIDFSGIYSLLNRSDVFTDFTSTSSIGLERAGSKESIGLWNFLWQVILAKELAVRLAYFPDSWIRGFTRRVLASVIVQDLWLKNVEIILTDAKISLDAAKKPESPQEQAKAEEFKTKGNDAMKKKEYQAAVDMYTKALEIDQSNAVYCANRSAAWMNMNKLEEARADAYIATQMDPKYAKAWSRLALTESKLGNVKRALDVYQHAIQVAGECVTSAMQKGLEDAEANHKAKIKAIEQETDKTAKITLHNAYLDEDWDITMKVAEFHSHVHERQVEGLLLFAERMKWPYINEMRDYAEDAYGNLRSGGTMDMHLHDWLFGLTLPGKWMSFKIMAALVMCTPSISKSIGVSHYYDCGVSLPKRSYWRARTVLGRVLGCLPGVISLCGWIGPCPPVEVASSTSKESKANPRYVRLKTRRNSPIEYTPASEDGVIHLRSHKDTYQATRMGPDEEVEHYLAEMKDPDKWMTPQPPVREVSICSIEAIKLKKLPLDINIAARQANREMSEEDIDKETEYRASIVFKMDDNETSVTYTLYTNPVFITPPPCHIEPNNCHEVHLREFPKYQQNIWTVDRLKDHTSEDVTEDVMVINATGKGAEVLARAWCSDRGRNAIIRRVGGPCFVCAVRSASKAGLGVGILIWVS
jgi:tetratricopeptide (TPR) repeat protein